MSKYHKINWRQSDEQELRRVVRNFDAKITRLAKNNPQIKNLLPEKVTVAELKELINTRQDFKREINAMKRFSRRGAELIVDVPGTDYNLKITKWQRTEMRRRIGIINRRRAKKREEIQGTEMTSRGESLGYTRGDFGMGKIEEAELRPMNAFTRRMKQSDIKWKWKAIRTESQSDYFDKKDYQVRENYIKGIKTHYDYERTKDIIEKIENMEISEFLDVFYKEGSSFEITSPIWKKKKNGEYDIKYDEYLAYENALRSTWMEK